MVCKSGCFRCAQLNWSVIEKEGYLIVRACADLSYLLQRATGFRLFCDHANLIKVFSPVEEVKQHVRSKLLRWSMQLVGQRYTIEHIPGSDNVWADLVSRWSPRQQLAVKTVRTRSPVGPSMLRPLQDPNFQWPSTAAVRAEQEQFRGSNAP